MNPVFVKLPIHFFLQKKKLMENVNFVWQTAYLLNYKTQVRDVHDLIIEKKLYKLLKMPWAW